MRVSRGEKSGTVVEFSGQAGSAPTNGTTVPSGISITETDAALRASRALDNPAVLIACILRSASSGWGCSVVPAHPFLQVLRTCSFHDPRTFLLPSLPWVLFEHAEPQIGSRRRREDPRAFHFQLLIGSRLEKAQPFPKEDRDNAHVDFVNQPGP